MRIVKFHKPAIVFLFVVPIVFMCTHKKDASLLSSSVRCDGFYYCVRPDDEKVMMVLQFFNNGKLRASQWYRRDGSIGEIADVKNAADSWLKQCEGFTMCASYRVDGLNIEFDLQFAGIEKIFAAGNPLHRRFTGKMLNDGRLTCTWDRDDTRFLFNFISDDHRHPTHADSLVNGNELT
jgi:hypothetical protein